MCRGRRHLRRPTRVRLMVAATSPNEESSKVATPLGCCRTPVFEAGMTLNSRPSDGREESKKSIWPTTSNGLCGSSPSCWAGQRVQNPDACIGNIEEKSCLHRDNAAIATLDIHSCIPCKAWYAANCKFVVVCLFGTHRCAPYASLFQSILQFSDHHHAEGSVGGSCR